MGLGLGILRLAPAAFWAMTPHELTAAAEAVLGRAPPIAPQRADLDRLMASFPDDRRRG